MRELYSSTFSTTPAQPSWIYKKDGIAVGNPFAEVAERVVAFPCVRGGAERSEAEGL